LAALVNAVGPRLKDVVRKTLNRAGVRVTRVPAPTENMGLARYERLYSADSLRERRFYNVGAGGFLHEYWTNVDYVSDHYAPLQHRPVHYDLMQCGPLPFESGTAELVYTSHTVEHVSDAAVENLFREAYRILKPGGGLRVTTGPDAELDYAALMRGDADWFYWDENYVTPGTYEDQLHGPATSVPLEERWLHHVASQLAPNCKSEHPNKVGAAAIKKLLSEKSMVEALDWLTAQCRFDPHMPGNHMSWWSKAKAMDVMRRAGFETVYPSAYGQSRFAVLRNTHYFDNTHPSMSLYVEAIKKA
jgi:SAM-dependent methyltransferase